MVQNPAFIEATLSMVERPLLSKLKAVRAEIQLLQSEREENVQRAAAVGGDETLALRRRDIDSKVEELNAWCNSLLQMLPLEDARALAELYRVRKEADAIEAARVKEADAALAKAYVAYQERQVDLRNAKREYGIVHLGATTVNEAMQKHQELHPDLYDPTVPRGQTPRLFEAAS